MEFPVFEQKLEAELQVLNQLNLLLNDETSRLQLKTDSPMAFWLKLPGLKVPPEGGGANGVFLPGGAKGGGSAAPAAGAGLNPPGV